MKILLTSTLSDILPSPLAAFPHYQRRDNGQRRERNKSYLNDYHQYSGKKLRAGDRTSDLKSDTLPAELYLTLFTSLIPVLLLFLLLLLLLLLLLPRPGSSVVGDFSFRCIFRLSPLQKHVRKVVGGFGKKSCVSTVVRKPGNTYASPTAMI